MAPNRPIPSEIDTHSIYHVESFRRRVGWGLHAFRIAKRNGLKVTHIHGRCYVRGCDFAAYLESLAQEAVDDA
ncbi:hypothetical protein [Symmachiella dynata]|uniref:hypothetical protein n=1 Tax=Symmachiella dynata TaxID=2527995 RepID=UPI0030EBD4D1